MGVVAPPHDLVDTDGVPEGHLGRADEARPEVALPPPVPARGERHRADHLATPLLLLRARRRRHAAVEVVECRQPLRHPGRALLGEDDVEPGMALEHAAEDEVPEVAVRPPRDLDEEHHVVDWAVAVVGHRAAAVRVHREPGLLARQPDGLVHGVVQGSQPRAGRRAGQEHAAQARAARPANLRRGGHRVVEGDLGDAGPPARRVGAEVGQPAVVSLQARPAAGQLGGVRGGGLQRERRLRVEGRDGVGVDHLGHDPVVLELAPATGRVPVAAPVGALQVVIGDLVGGGPGVELVAIARLEVGAVLLELPAGVAIGRDHRVAVAHRPLPGSL